MSLAPGVRLGAYEVVAPLGAGGMGEVYRARDTRVGREVAIKILPGECSSDPERLTRFEQEARACAALNHPNILALFDVGQHQGAPFIVSELLEGQTLRERLSTSPLPVRKAVELAIQIAQGLAAAHDKNIVHRDLKPENVFITEDGRAKILDFGLAKLTQTEPALSGISVLPTTPPQTTPGVVLGTIGYMSPEQVRGHAADHRSDIFALGALLYEMLSGRRAFGGDTPMDAMSSILKEDPPDLPSAGERQTPPALSRIVDRCLEKNPVARFQSTRDLSFALEGVNSQSGVMPVAEQPGGRRGNHTARIAVALAIALSLTAAALATALLRQTPTPQPTVRFTISSPEGAAFAGGGGFAPGQAVSPDGQQIVFMAQRPNGVISLWIRRLDGLESRSLEGTESGGFPFWSPDSRFVAFFANGKLKKIDVTGGTVQTIADARAGEGGTWNTGDVIVYAAYNTNPLMRVSAEGGEPVAVTTFDESRKDISHRWPHFLPDGQRFLFLAQPSGEIRVGSLDASATKTLLTADSKAMFAPPGYLMFMRGQTLMAQPFSASALEFSGDPIPVAEEVRLNVARAGRAAFSVSESGILTYRSGSNFANEEVTWFDRGGTPLRVLASRGRYRGVALSPDGKRAIVTQIEHGSASADLWMFDIERGVPTKFTFGPANEVAAVWSPDGERLVFSSNKDTNDAGGYNLYVKPSSGVGEEEILFKDNTGKYASTWSPDGGSLIYGTGRDLWLLSIAGERKKMAFLQSPFIEGDARFSPDGRWVAFRSSESGQPEVYVAPFPGPGPKVRVSPTGANAAPRWRRDGKELFYVAADETVMAAEVNGQAAAFVVSGVRPLFRARPQQIISDVFDVSADGQRFLIVTDSEDVMPEPLTVVLNWVAALKN